jgi:hypothetical protein
MEKLRIASGIGLAAALGWNVTMIGVKISTPAHPSKPTGDGGASSLVVVVPDGAVPGERMTVTFESGSRATVTVPAGLAPGARFTVRPPKAASTNPLFAERTEPESEGAAALRGGLVGLTVGSGLVVSPFVLYGGTRGTKVLAPIATLPVAVTCVAVGAYAGILESRLPPVES